MTSQAVACDATIEKVFLRPDPRDGADHQYFRLVGQRDTLIKVHVLSPTGADAPPVTATFTVGDESETFTLEGPAKLPTSADFAPATVEHRFDDCFTAMIPGKWIRRPLTVTITAGDQTQVLDDLPVGARRT
jgi:hypothetical protein